MGSGHRREKEKAGQVSPKEAAKIHRSICRANDLDPKTTTRTQLAEFLAQNLTRESGLERRMVIHSGGTHRRGITINGQSTNRG